MTALWSVSFQVKPKYAALAPVAESMKPPPVALHSATEVSGTGDACHPGSPKMCGADQAVRRRKKMEDEGRLEPAAYRPAISVQPRVVVGLLLILAGLVWAVARGLISYGIGPVDLGYDLDQPPVLLVLVGAWLVWRGLGR